MAVKVTTSPDGRRLAGFAGLQSCGSVWACPCCSAKIAETRRAEIDHVLRWWGSTGGRVAMATFTVRHTKAQRLRTVWDGVSAGWGAVTSGRGWVQDQAAHGSSWFREVKRGKRKGQMVDERVIHTIRVAETTHGDNGWHVHLHVLLLLDGSATDRSVQLLADGMFQRWRRGVTDKGLGVPSRKRGIKVDLVKGDPTDALSDYFSKQVYDVSHEAASGMAKSARYGNRTPFAILADIVRLGLVDDVEAWQEWERGSKGRRQLTWSQGLREAAALEPEMSDEDVVDEAVGGDIVAEIDKDTWGAIAREAAQALVLDAFEVSTEAGLSLLTEYRLRARPPLDPAA